MVELNLLRVSHRKRDGVGGGGGKHTECCISCVIWLQCLVNNSCNGNCCNLRIYFSKFILNSGNQCSPDWIFSKLGFHSLYLKIVHDCAVHSIQGLEDGAEFRGLESVQYAPWVTVTK